jgi:acyl-CoA thioesterase
MDTHPFDLALALQPQGEHRFRARTSAAYANFIAPYGGMTAAQAMRAVLQHPKLLGEPVSLTINYAAALAGGEFDIVAVPVRTNRSTQHWTLSIEQQGEVAVTATAITAVRRPTFAAQEAQMPPAPQPAEVPWPKGRGLVEWTRRYEMRFVEGGFDGQWHGQDAGDSHTRMWMRDDPPRPLDFESLTALADIFFPRIWRRRASPVPVGTVTLTVYFHATAGDLRQAGDGYLFGEVRGHNFGRGYFDQTGHLWSEAGTLLATTHQVVYYKE